MSASSNTSHAEYKNEHVAVESVTQIILTNFPDSFARVVDKNGLSAIKIMDYIETSAVISDVGVAERNILSVLQMHLKVKFNGKRVFSKKKNLDKLMKLMPPITTTEPMFEIE